MQRHKVVDPSFPDAQVMWSMAPLSFEDVTKSYAAWLSQANKLRDEALRFAEDQFTKEIEVAAQLARCTNPGEALALQAAFANKMMTDYFAEGQKMVELMTEMANEISLSPKYDTAHH